MRQFDALAEPEMLLQRIDHHTSESGKPVLLLKDRTVETLQADLAGKLYKPFDPHDPEGIIPGQLTNWLEDYGIIVPKRA